MVADEQFDDEELDDINDGSGDENVTGEGGEEPEQKRTIGERAQELKDKYNQAKNLKKKLDKSRNKGGQAIPTPQSIPKPQTKEEAGQKKSLSERAQEVKDKYDQAKDIENALNALRNVGSAAQAGGGATAAGGAAAAGGTAAATGGVVVGGGVAVPVAIILIIILVLALLVWIFVSIFMGGRNKINSMAGGSFFMTTDYNSAENQQIVKNLQDKRDGKNLDHKLVINGEGSKDIDWQCDENGQCTHKLDIRLLKTLDYLTDKHDYIEIGMLRTNAPTLLRHSLSVEPASANDTEETSQSKIKEEQTFSAFYTGQAMAITAVDYSNIDPPYDPKTQPIEFSWQKTVMEKVTRPIWEELAFDVGYLDSHAFEYQQTATLDLGDLNMGFIINDYKLSLINAQQPSLYKETFNKLDRILELLGRIMDADRGTYTPLKSKKDIFDRRTIDYIQKATSAFAALKSNIDYGVISGPDQISNAELEKKIRSLGSQVNIDLLYQGTEFVYKATQVANMVDWNEKSPAGTTKNLEWNQAYEARNKIRQVIKELLEMPREIASLDSDESTNFNYDMVVKQIITHSPEDDLDNGRMNIDVFPKGITAVDVGGVAIEGTKVETEKDAEGNIISGATIGDGVVDAADAHFSYKPIDTGVFSKFGTNYIFVNIPDSIIEGVGEFLKVTIGTGTYEALYKRWVGKCAYNPLNESCRPITYQGFLHVAF